MLSFSIIIPTYNRCSILARTLASVAHLNHSQSECEILVVDNGSIDQTREAFESARSNRAELNWRYFYEPVPGLLSGRHRGALEAKGSVCVFLDDDVRVSCSWLEALEEAFTDPQVTLVGGPSHPIFESASPAWLTDFYTTDEYGRLCTWLSLFDGGGSIKEVDPCYVWGLNFAIRKDVLLKLGGFHPDCIPKALQRFQGDGETGLSLKLREGNFKAVYHPGALVKHEIPDTRLTHTYFKQRAFYQGVCDSYTLIRANGGLVSDPVNWKSALRSVKDFFVKRISPSAQDISDRHREIKIAYNNGYAFHHKEVKRDRALRDWVLKQDYWDYQLPDGWKKFLAPSN